MNVSPPSSPKGTAPHFCQARGCDTEIDPRLLMCSDHWAHVPPALRESIEATYRLGQERDGQPSEQYRAFAAAAIAEVAHKQQRQRRTPSKPVQLALFNIG